MYGQFGGQYVSDGLKIRLDEISKNFEEIKKDPQFKKEYFDYLRDYVGRPSPLDFATRLGDYCGCKIYLKREDLNHTGAHKINNAIGQALLAKRMGKTHIIAETGAGSHGCATASACAMLDLKCTIFMGKEDMLRQAPNVKRMQLMGAEVVEVTRGNSTLRDAIDEAFDYLMNHEDVFYLIGSAVGPEPYPEMVEYFQKIIGEEAKKQILETENRLPNAIVACVGGGSNAIGIFSDFIDDKDVELYGIEAAGKGIDTKMHASAMSENNISIMHGMKSYFLPDGNGGVRDAYSLSAGLDYPGIGPKHAYLSSINRVKYDSIEDQEAVEAFKLLSKLEGIIPALESSFAVAYAIKLAKTKTKDDIIIINLSGRGDKDLDLILNN
ncbi:MAG: tryptophan synthase subunit beta [Firmicutes bacterium]|nr:tryptophan synthase subunit beta [Candidatus Colivicinus equi]